MNRKKYIVRLSKDERLNLEKLVKTGKVAAYKRLHAQILLKADVSPSGPGWDDQKISQAFDISTKTIERLRKRLIEEGLEGALQRHKQQNRYRKMDGDLEARLITLACSKPPEGHSCWTLRLLANKLVELGYIESISYEAVRRALKKTS